MDKDQTITRPWVSALAWTAATGALLFGRFPHLLLRPRLWAEDGNIFFLHASTNWLADVFNPYSGYFHLLPRTVAWVGHKLDPAWIPVFYVYASLAVTLGVAALLFSRRLNLPCKPLLALAIVAVPDTGEVFLTPTNLQWITALSLLIVLLMADPRGWLAWTCDTLVLAVAGLTGPFSIFAAPFFLFRALGRRTAASWVLLFVITVAAATQAWQIYHYPPSSGYPHGPFDLPDLVAVLSSHGFLVFFNAQAWVQWAPRALVIALGLVLLAATASSLLVKDEFWKGRVLLLLFVGVLVGFTTFRVRSDLWDYREVINADRYYYIPRVILLWVAASCLHGRSMVVRAACVGAALLLLAVTWYTPYLEGPAYTARHVVRAYYPWAPFVGALRRGEPVEIQWSPGWKCVVPARTPPDTPGISH